jgi:SPP1 gp7 family putative phage head morphogenesis protein
MPRNDPRERAAFARIKRAEKGYGINLRRLARHVADLIDGAGILNFRMAAMLEGALRKYAEIIEPWAASAAARMLAEVQLRDTQAWEAHTREMGQLIKRELRLAPTGQVMQRLQSEQVGLIKSLPLQAAQRVHEMTLEGISSGERFEDIAKRIQAQGGITKNRATLIARTEVGRAASNLTQARAQFVGSDSYIWRTSNDPDVRDSHKRMEGKVIRWDSPPTVDKGVAPYHAGCIYNCRCWAEPIVPDHFE